MPHGIHQCKTIAGSREMKITNQRRELFCSEKQHCLFDGGCGSHFKSISLQRAAQSAGLCRIHLHQQDPRQRSFFFGKIGDF